MAAEGAGPEQPMLAQRGGRPRVAALLVLLGSGVLYLAYLGTAPQPLHSHALHVQHTPLTEAAVSEGEEPCTARNRTPEAARLLVYNRVPKCGSTTMQAVLRTLSHMNNFTHRSSTVYGQRRLSPAQEAHYAHSLHRELAGMRTPLSVDRHFYYLDFARYGLPRPVYINMLREPIERFVSSFYYARSPERWERLMKNKGRSPEERRLPRIPRDVRRVQLREGGSKSYYHSLLVAGRRRELAASSWANKNFSACVLRGERECAFTPGTTRETTVSFFCGSHPHCLIVNGREALQRAKHNLETAYSVVGVVEELELSMAVMEQYAPLHLRAMRHAFHQKLREEMRQRNRTPHPEPSPLVRRALERNLTGDIELYRFARQRLHLQGAALHLAQPPSASTPSE